MEGKINAKVNLAKKGMSIDTICSRCQMVDETVENALLLCGQIQHIWKNILEKVGIANG